MPTGKAYIIVFEGHDGAPYLAGYVWADNKAQAVRKVKEDYNATRFWLIPNQAVVEVGVGMLYDLLN